MLTLVYPSLGLASDSSPFFLARCRMTPLTVEQHGLNDRCCHLVRHRRALPPGHELCCISSNNVGTPTHVSPAAPATERQDASAARKSGALRRRPGQEPGHRDPALQPCPASQASARALPVRAARQIAHGRRASHPFVASGMVRRSPGTSTSWPIPPGQSNPPTRRAGGKQHPLASNLSRGSSKCVAYRYTG